MRLPNGTNVFVPRFHETGKIISCVHPYQIVKKYRVRLSGDRIVRLGQDEFERVEHHKESEDLPPADDRSDAPRKPKPR